MLCLHGKIAGSANFDALLDEMNPAGCGQSPGSPRKRLQPAPVLLGEQTRSSEPVGAKLTFVVGDLITCLRAIDPSSELSCMRYVV